VRELLVVFGSVICYCCNGIINTFEILRFNLISGVAVL